MKRIEPKDGQESVWDYPRPPKLQASNKLVQVIFNDVLLAETRAAYRVLETSHPPVYYIPPADVRLEFLRQTKRSTICEWKGQAGYYSIEIGEKSLPNVAWFYANPTQPFLPIKDYVAFYPSLMDACFVDGERVQSQEGDFYGGWITSEIVGPFKGGAGTWGW
jgi:uncharacterized protein (DUF427 family)